MVLLKSIILCNWLIVNKYIHIATVDSSFFHLVLIGQTIFYDYSRTRSARIVRLPLATRLSFNFQTFSCTRFAIDRAVRFSDLPTVEKFERSLR